MELESSFLCNKLFIELFNYFQKIFYDIMQSVGVE